MFKSETEVIEWISNQLRLGIRPGLKRMEMALDLLGNPHLQLKTIHIGGTNGKGSTVTFLCSVLKEAGYKVGTYTSPYIETFNERISLNNLPISETDLVLCANQVYPVIEQLKRTEFGPFTEFEIMTLVSFIFFHQQEVDLIIYEVGLGGRLDATNVIYPLVCGITNIGHDHQEILGNTLVKVAYEKLGIVKREVPLFTTEEREELLSLFKERTSEKNSLLIQSLIKYKPTNVKFNVKGAVFDWPNMKQVSLSMKGEHQIKNATLAYSIIDYLRKNKILTMSPLSIYDGMRKAFWKGRFEVIGQDPLIILDGAHNIEGVKGLCETLQAIYPDKRPTFMVSMLANKDDEGMFKLIKPYANRVYFTSFEHPRAQTGLAQYQAFAKPSRSGYREDHQELLHEIIPTLANEDCLVITGSLYFISEIRKYFI